MFLFPALELGALIPCFSGHLNKPLPLLLQAGVPSNRFLLASLATWSSRPALGAGVYQRLQPCWSLPWRPLDVPQPPPDTRAAP